jgi:ubiquinone/menaquinone biosynthesis C-methylase UbiE
MTLSNRQIIHATKNGGDPAARPALDFAALKARQQLTWATGDFAIIGTTLQIVGETLCEAANVCAGEQVIDVACGNGNATLAAARRFAAVTGVDFVPSLLERARARAAAEGLTIDLHEGDAESLPFADGTFDVVLSTFGCMFTPQQERAAAELVRVCRPEGRIGMANWTAEGFIGQLFRVIGRHLPPPAGLRSPSEWGNEARLAELFGSAAARIQARRTNFAFRYRSAEHWLDIFRRYYGPVNKAFAALEEPKRGELAEEIIDLLHRFDRGGETLVVPSEYLEVVVHRA